MILKIALMQLNVRNENVFLVYYVSTSMCIKFVRVWIKPKYIIEDTKKYIIIIKIKNYCILNQ